MSDYTAVRIGHDAAAIDKLETILQMVLNTNAGDSVKIAAIQAIEDAFKIGGNSINNCVFYATPKEEFIEE